MKKLLYILIVNCSLLITHCYPQWVQQTVPVTMPITGIKFIDTSKGWACTGTFNVLDTGFIMNTTNGGTNWNIQLRYPAMKFTDIEFINQSTGFIAGNQNDSARTKLFTTTNGGLNWSYISMVTNMYIDDMQFLNKDSAWECGSSAGPDVRTTTDGGNTWIVRTNGILSATQRIFFLNYNTGFCGANSNLYKTTNAGVNWNLLYNTSDGVFSLFFINEATGWIGSSNDKIYFTSNAGINWQQQIVPPFAGTTTDIYFVNTNTGWAGNRSLYIFKTINGGINWGYQRDTSRSYRIAILNNNYGWSCDNGISKTTNSGGNITYVGINNISNEIPPSFKLYQNYPNPFNPRTSIKFEIPEFTFVNVVIYDILGRIIKTEVNEYLKAGTYSLNFDAADLPSGLYFFKININNYTETKKMLLIK
jgi:photosystem II stability/assembly factor-like uncharacterized protein